MYLSHYNLLEKPFQITADPRFLWLGEKHQEALATLTYAVLDNKGFLLLTGDVGTGKTTLIHALLKDLDSNTIVATIVDPELKKLEFFTFLGQAFAIRDKFTQKVDFVAQFKRFLDDAYSNHKKVLLIIDEAQKLSEELLEEIRLLSNIEKENTKLLNIFFVGQNEFNKTLTKESCRALRQRITVTYQIKSLTADETGQYIKHRLKVAGTEKEIFNKGAIREIYAFSCGYPRLINIMCDHALLTGYVRELKSITPQIVKECATELTLPGEIGPNDLAGPLPVVIQAKKSHKRTALYASLVFVVAVCGYLFNELGYDEYIKNVKNYYGQIFSGQQGFGSKGQVREPKVPEPQHSVIPHAISRVEAPHTMSSPGIENHKLRETPNDVNREKIYEPTAGESESNPLYAVLMEQGVTNRAGPDSSHEAEPVVLSEDFALIIPFNHDTNELPQEAYGNLDRLAAAMAQNIDVEVVLKGYTDSLGTRHYNKKLSEFRANIVKSYLVAKGINPSRIHAIGKGHENPVEPNDTIEGRAANRRVEIQLQIAGGP
jgi:general secretion pathway protein A